MKKFFISYLNDVLEFEDLYQNTLIKKRVETFFILIMTSFCLNKKYSAYNYKIFFFLRYKY